MNFSFITNSELRKHYKMFYLTWKFTFQEYKRCTFQTWALLLLILSMQKVLGKFWYKLQNDPFHLKIFILGIWKVLVSNMAFNVACFVYLIQYWKKHFAGRIWVKSKNYLFDSTFKLNDESLKLLVVFILIL